MEVIGGNDRGRPAAAELGGWIATILADFPGPRAAVVLGRTGRVARRLAGQERRVIALEVARSHAWFERATLGEGLSAIGEHVVLDWVRTRREPEVVGRFAAWARTAFTAEEAAWLGIWRANILESGLPEAEAAIGVVAVMRTMAYWLAWNEISLGHKPLPPSTVFRHYLGELKRTKGRHPAGEIRQIGLSSWPRLPACDLLYCYVPPREGMKAMDPRLSFWERWVLGDPEAPLEFDVEGRLGGWFASETDRATALGALLERMVDIPTWSLAYSGDGDALAVAVERLRPLSFRHEVAVPYPCGQESTIMKEGLMVARIAA